MRISYSEDEDFPGQFNIWQANCRRSIKGKAGQAALRDLEAALLALPEKRLIHGALTDDDGGVCAIAAYGKHKGVDLAKFDQDYGSDEVGIEAGMPRLVAWKVVELNDMEFDGRWGYAEGPDQYLRYPSYAQHCGVWTFFPYSPEERYEKMLAWVREQLGGERGARRER